MNGNLLFAGTEFGAVHERRRRQRLGAAQGRHAGDPGSRHDGPEARERSRARRRSAAASTSSTTTARCARSRRQRCRGRAAVPAARRVPVQPARPGAGGRGGPRRRWPATGRAPNPPFGAVFTYQRAQELPADAKLVLTISRRRGRAGSPHRPGEGSRPAAFGVESARRSAPPGTTAAAAAGAAAGGRGGFGGGRGNQGPLVQPGRYRATLGRLVGDMSRRLDHRNRLPSCKWRSDGDRRFAALMVRRTTTAGSNPHRRRTVGGF